MTLLLPKSMAIVRLLCNQNFLTALDMVDQLSLLKLPLSFHDTSFSWFPLLLCFFMAFSLSSFSGEPIYLLVSVVPLC